MLASRLTEVSFTHATALPKGRNLASNAGIQTGQGIPGSEAKGDIKGHCLS
jgi:hypothetical protein